MAGSGQSFRFIDLFAGLGGFHVALEGLGGKGVFAAEWDTELNELYRENYGISPWLDVNTLDTDETIASIVPDHEILTAGFPCQPFSKSGKQQGFEHTLQGNLFFKVHDILRVKRPNFFILENVPNILSHEGGKTRATIEKMLRTLGYEVDIRRLSPHQYGIPQVRERAYFIGALTIKGGLTKYRWPAKIVAETSITSALRPSASSTRPVPESAEYAMDMWGDFLSRAPGDIKLPSFPIWAMEFRASYPYEQQTPPKIWAQRRPSKLAPFAGSFGFPLEGLTIAEQKTLIPSHSRRDGDIQFPTWKRTFIRQNREFYSQNRKWINPWLDEWRPWELHSSFQKLEWNAQGGARDIEEYVIQMRASGVRVKRPTTAPALIAMTSTQVPILGARISGTGERRYMTTAECARLQSLENINLPANEVAAYKALGNAVNAQVVRRIAEPLVNDLAIERRCRKRESASNAA